MLNRLNKLAAMGLVLAVAGGCAMESPFQRVKNSPTEQDSSKMVVGDPAMQLRQWDRSTAEYGNGNVVAGTTGFWYEARPGQPEWRYLIEDNPLFLLQAAALPVTLTLTPPWTPVLYAGESVGPSHTALPPLPAGSGMSREMSMPAPTTQP